jgi:Ca2+-binding EF-hand superfamily protein
VSPASDGSNHALRLFFDEVDHGHAGFVSKRELVCVMDVLGLPAPAIEGEGKGQYSFQGFLQLMEQQSGNGPSIDELMTTAAQNAPA